MTRSADEIRREFLEFFRSKGHAIVPSAPVVPHDDPTLLFTNAGMNQFKDVFLATGTRDYQRVANTQKCIRAGGKHNDLDDVGHDTYHHTFFEMLGNWSFGDYFKKEAIEWAWELLTEVWGLDKSRLHATYFGGLEKSGIEKGGIQKGTEARRHEGTQGSARVSPASTCGTGVSPVEWELEPDYESRDLWATVTDIDPSHIHPGNMKDNFWEMGETGPCGPCSEIHIDLTPDNSGAQLVNAGDPRVIELWNLVFIQFNRGRDRKLTPLPARHVDTGMGFERLTALLQGKTSNYDTDVFTPIFEAIRDVTGAPPYAGTLPEPNRDREGAARRVDDPQIMIDVSYRVIADHIRCLTFALTDGAVPDREGRGFVLRRILRRAVFYGRQYLNMHEPFLFRLVPIVADVMADAFAELRTAHAGKNVEYVAELIREEEESFYRTLDRGIELFQEAVAEAVGRAIADDEGGRLVTVTRDPLSRQKFWRLHFTHREGPVAFSEFNPEVIEAWTRRTPVLSGKDAFKLHDTYGFPIDLTQIMADEKGLRVDIGEYERLMEEARERARARPREIDEQVGIRIIQSGPNLRFGDTDDSPKYVTNRLGTELWGIVPLSPDIPISSWRAEAAPSPANSPVRSLEAGQDAALFFSKTCFYTEQGGQVADTGLIVAESGSFEVKRAARFGDAIAHIGTLRSGKLTVRQMVELRVDPTRAQTMQNHTATHLLNWALREVLGEHVQQKGSLVDQEKTRFDFAHPRPVTPEEIGRVEDLVNERIDQKLTVHDQHVPQAEALKIRGLRAVFGERYPDTVRVLSIGAPVEELFADPENERWAQHSIEFCGGTHVHNTGDIQHFILTTEEGVAKGIRRVVGTTGRGAQLAEEIGRGLVERALQLKSASPQEITSAIAHLQKTTADAPIPVRQRIKLRDAIGELQRIVREQQKVTAAGAADIVNARVDELLASAEKVGETTIVVAEMPDVPIEQLKNGADRIKQKCGSAAVLFGVRVGVAIESDPEAQARDKPSQGKALLLAAMTDDLVKKGLKAGDLVKHVAPMVEGGGGGSPTMAQAGGKNAKRLADTLTAGKDWIRQRLT